MALGLIGLGTEDGTKMVPNELQALLGKLDEEQAAFIELMNYLGHRIQTTGLNNGITEIDVSSLSSGVYHYSIHVDGLLRQTGKQVILK